MDTPEHLRTTKVNKQISDVSIRHAGWILELGSGGEEGGGGKQFANTQVHFRWSRCLQDSAL